LKKQSLLFLFLFITPFFVFTQISISDSAKYFEGVSDYKKAEKYYLKSLEANTSNDSNRVVTLISLARVKRINQKYPEGIELLKKATALSDSIQSNYLTLKTAVQLGDYYRAIGALEISLSYFKKLNPKAFSKFPDLENQYYHRKAAIFNEWQYIEPKDSTHLLALEFSKKALKIARKNNWPDPLATSYNEMANIYEKNGKLESALTYYVSACYIFKKENLLDYINASKNKIRVTFTQKKFQRCIEKGKEILELSKDKNWPYLEYPILHYMAQSYYALNDSLLGMKYDLLNKQKLIETNESMHEKDLSELQVEFDISNKEKEIEIKEIEISQSKTFQNRLMILLGILTLSIGAIIFLYFNGLRKNKKLNQLLKENAFLIGEANHRIKNNLQLIISLLSKEIRKADSSNSQQLLGIKAKIESISTLHQQLYLNEDKSTIDIKFYLNEIIKNLQSIIEAKEVQIRTNIEISDFPIEKSLHLGLLVTELIINSLKHAFETSKNKEKFISISLDRKHEKFNFTYTDNGIGLSKDDKPRLIYLLSKQLKSKVKTVNANGYKFELEIPK